MTINFFGVEAYGDIYKASQAASLTAREFSNPYRLRYPTQPPLWVKFDRELNGYVIEPNDLYSPNLPWNDLQESIQGNF